VAVPGPSALVGGLGLLAFVAVLVLAGEGARGLLGRRISLFATSSRIEAVLWDFYLAGAGLYVLAVLPLGLFLPVIVGALLVVGGTIGLLALRPTPRGSSGRLRGPRTDLPWPALLAILGAGATFVLEFGVAQSVPTGNTFDSSVDALFASLLQLHGNLPITLAPVASGTVGYPQGSTVLFLLAQWMGNLPPGRTSLLVTPVFIAFTPLAAYVLGTRWVGTRVGGGVFALAAVVLLPLTRFTVGGSNDFVLALPLVLLLASRVPDWLTTPGPAVSFVVGFGSMVGFSAAINPVGAEWLSVLLLVAWVARTPWAGVGGAIRWVGRWLAGVGVALVWVAVPVAALLSSATGTRTGTPAPTSPGGEFLALTDPFVVQASNLARSPFPVIQIELAALLVVGASLLLLFPAVRRSGRTGELGPLAFAGSVSGIALIALATIAGRDALPGVVGSATSLPELSILLFTMYGAIALVPLLLLADAVRPPSSIPRLASFGSADGPTTALSPAMAALLVALLLVPGVVVTVDGTPGVLHSTYGSFSQVTPDDFALLDWSAHHLPPGARVLAAPGSAAEFLPAYDAAVVLLYPMYGPAWATNASYLDLRALLPNGTLGSTGASDLAALDVEYIAITGNDTTLFPAFSATPFLSDPSFTELFHSGDAYLFARS
jgi:hypothetical protein